MKKFRIHLQQEVLEFGDEFGGNDCEEYRTVVDKHQPDLSVPKMQMV